MPRIDLCTSTMTWCWPIFKVQTSRQVININKRVNFV